MALRGSLASTTGPEGLSASVAPPEGSVAELERTRGATQPGVHAEVPEGSASRRRASLDIDLFFRAALGVSYAETWLITADQNGEAWEWSSGWGASWQLVAGFYLTPQLGFGVAVGGFYLPQYTVIRPYYLRESVELTADTTVTLVGPSVTVYTGEERRFSLSLILGWGSFSTDVGERRLASGEPVDTRSSESGRGSGYELNLGYELPVNDYLRLGLLLGFTTTTTPIGSGLADAPFELEIPVSVRAMFILPSLRVVGTYF